MTNLQDYLLTQLEEKTSMDKDVLIELVKATGNPELAIEALLGLTKPVVLVSSVAPDTESAVDKRVLSTNRITQQVTYSYRNTAITYEYEGNQVSSYVVSDLWRNLSTEEKKATTLHEFREALPKTITPQEHLQESTVSVEEWNTWVTPK